MQALCICTTLQSKSVSMSMSTTTFRYDTITYAGPLSYIVCTAIWVVSVQRQKLLTLICAISTSRVGERGVIQSLVIHLVTSLIINIGGDKVLESYAMILMRLRFLQHAQSSINYWVTNWVESTLKQFKWFFKRLIYNWKLTHFNLKSIFFTFFMVFKWIYYDLKFVYLYCSYLSVFI